MGVLSMWKKRGHGEPDKLIKAQTKEGGVGELEGRDRAEITWTVALLERIAYQTSGLALTFDQYLDMVETSAPKPASKI